MNLKIGLDEFQLFQAFVGKELGINLSDSKKALVAGRLAKRLKVFGLDSYQSYYEFITSQEGSAEKRQALDLLTTNETWFFREPKHFDFLSRYASQHKGSKPFRVWSAASSSGEEAYSIAMTLAESMNSSRWEVFGSDVSHRIVEKARTGMYPMARTEDINQDLLKKYCLKGTGENDGTFIIGKQLRDHVEFNEINLIESLPDTGMFDVIFLRNCLIYFDIKTKIKIVDGLLTKLRPNGIFMLGHSETITGINSDLDTIQTAVYKKTEQ